MPEYDPDELSPVDEDVEMLGDDEADESGLAEQPEDEYPLALIGEEMDEEDEE